MGSRRLVLKVAAVLASTAWTAAAGLAATDSPSVLASHAWIRWLPAGLPAAGYVTLENRGDRTLTLIGAASQVFGEISLHQMRAGSSTVGMTPVGAIDVAPRSTLDFEAAGYHMMLMRPTRPVAPGNHVTITLQFAGGRSLAVEFDVRKPDSAAAHRDR